MSHSCKIYEATVLKSQGEEIDKSITQRNHGFMKGKSCVTALTEL